jgi:hypothetical protein
VIFPFPFLVRMHGEEYRVSRQALFTLVSQGERLHLPEAGLVLWQDTEGRWWLRGRAKRPQGPYASPARVVREVIHRRRRKGRKR